MEISEIYNKYELMSNLKVHQLRVAAVATLISDNFESQLDNKRLITASLLHDMGNIIKFDLAKFPEFLKPKGFEYWKGIREKFIKKYGNNEHEATIIIAKNLTKDKKTIKLIDSIGFRQSINNYKSSDILRKICAYSDMRVMPHGIDTLENRLADLKERYRTRMDSKKLNSFDIFANYFYKIEKQIFDHCTIKPEDITEKKAEHIVESLKDFDIT